MPDTNGDEAKKSPDERGEYADQYDETWLLNDRDLIDDELYALWAVFAPKVRIIVLSDSCHSGTITRDRPKSIDPLPSRRMPAAPSTGGVRGAPEALRRHPAQDPES